MQQRALALGHRLLPGREAWKLAAAGLLIASALLHLHAATFSEDLLDFGSFWESGRAVNEGSDPYGIYPNTHRPIEPPHVNPNLNPPTSLLLFAPLGLLDPYLARNILWWVGFVTYALLAVFLISRYRPPDGPLIAAWTLALPAFWSTLSLGQIYVLLLIPAVFGWLMLERGQAVTAGVAIGILSAFKPNMLVWPAMLFLAGHRREAMVSAVSFLCVSLLPLIVWGPDIYVRWFELFISDDPIRRTHFVNASLSGITARLGLPFAGIVISVGLLCAAALAAFKWRPDRLKTSGFAIALSTVASPLAWLHYLLFLLPPIFARRSWRPVMIVACAMLAVPIGVIGWLGVELANALPEATWVSGITVQSYYSWTALLFAVALARDFVPPPGQGRERKN